LGRGGRRFKSGQPDEHHDDQPDAGPSAGYTAGLPSRSPLGNRRTVSMPSGGGRVPAAARPPKHRCRGSAGYLRRTLVAVTR
jgi:hypothetical protein